MRLQNTKITPEAPGEFCFFCYKLYLYNFLFFLFGVPEAHRESHLCDYRINCLLSLAFNYHYIGINKQLEVVKVYVHSCIFINSSEHTIYYLEDLTGFNLNYDE